MNNRYRKKLRTLYAAIALSIFLVGLSFHADGVVESWVKMEMTSPD